MMLKRFLVLILPLTLLAATGCEKQEAAAPEAPVERPAIAVEVVPVQARDVADAIEVVGSLAPRYEATIKSEYQGLISEVFVTEWVRVKKGDPLAELDTREGTVQVEGVSAQLETMKAQEEAARANVSLARAARIRAEREARRLLGLKDAGLVTQQQLDDAQTALEVAQAQENSAKAQLAAAEAQTKAGQKSLAHAETRLGKFLITAPMDGVVAFRGANPGDLVGEPGSAKVMFQIVDTRVLDLTVSVPSNRLGDLGLGQPISFTTDAVPGASYSGVVRFINPTVEESDRSVKVTAEVDNRDEHLKGGLFVKGRIVTGVRKGVILVPRIAFLALDSTKSRGDLFLVADNKAQRREVVIGKAYGENVEVISGLEPGQTIITRGGYHVKDGDPVKIIHAAGK